MCKKLNEEENDKISKKTLDEITNDLFESFVEELKTMSNDELIDAYIERFGEEVKIIDE